MNTSCGISYLLISIAFIKYNEKRSLKIPKSEITEVPLKEEGTKKTTRDTE